MTDYITLDQFKTTHNIQNTDSDADISISISAASQQIDQDTDRRFWADADAEQVRMFIPENNGFCIIDDLAEFTSLTYQNDAWTLNEDFYFTPMNADADGFPFTGIRTIAKPFIFTRAESPAGWAAFDGRITLTGKFGWPGDVPAPIIRATTILATKLFQRPTLAPFSNLGIGVDGAVARTGTVDAEYRAAIRPFERNMLWYG